jgi:hypothetical protein
VDERDSHKKEQILRFCGEMDRAPIRSVVELYSLGRAVLCVLAKIGCRVGTDLLTFDDSAILAVDGCGEVTFRRISLLKRYFEARYGRSTNEWAE